MINGEHISSLVNFERSSSAWYWNSDGVLTQSIVDEPRFEYDPATGQSLGLLIEEERTNEILNSRDLTAGTWFSTATASRNQVGIDGISNTACEITDGDAGQLETVVISSFITIDNDSNTHVASVFIKKDEDESRLSSFHLAYFGGTSVNTEVQINTKTGTGSFVGANDDGAFNVENYGDWWRLSLITSNNETGNTNVNLQIKPASGTILGTNDSSVTGSAIFDQVQFEIDSSFASSPIITGGNTKIRMPEIVKVTDMEWYNQQTGTFLSEFETGEDLLQGRLVSVSDGSSANRIELHIDNEGGLTDSTETDDSVQSGLGELSVSIKTSYKAVLSFKESDMILVVDGEIIGTSTPNIPNNLTQLLIGSSVDGQYLNGHIRSLRYYPRRFSNTKLQEFTS